MKKAQAICSYKIVEGENHSVRIQVREEEFCLPEISAMVLREMKSIAEARLGQPVAKAVITVPAYFNDNQRQATRDAARIAGLEVLRILNEPTAAALAYGFGKDLHQKVAVYDLGGGTFDISVLEIGEDVFEVLSTCGDTYLGGDDFDDRLIDWLADEFLAREGINLRNDPFALEKLKVAAETAKKGLSVEDEVEIRIPDIIAVPDGSSRSIQRTLTQRRVLGAHHRPGPAHVQGVRRGAPGGGPGRARPRRRDPGRRPDAAPDDPQGGARVLPAGAATRRRPRRGGRDGRGDPRRLARRRRAAATRTCST